MKIIAFFDEIEQKIWFKIGVGKLMKIFFMRNVPNNISWSLGVLAVTSEMISPRKPWKKFHDFSCFLTTVGISIVNACTVASLYRNAHFYEGEEPDVDCSNFTNTWPIFNFRRLYHYLRSKSFSTRRPSPSGSFTSKKERKNSARRAISCNESHPFRSLFTCIVL